MNAPPSTAVVPPAPAPVSDEAAWFCEQVQPHETALRQFLRRQVPTPADVDDVVQESFVKVLRARTLGRIDSARAFLFVVARNTAANLFRKGKIYSPVPVSELPEWRVLDGGQNVAAIVNAHLQEELLAEAVAQLPERCREIFLLRVSDGLSFAEIATRLGVRESTVRTQVVRAVEKCAQTLREKGALK